MTSPQKDWPAILYAVEIRGRVRPRLSAPPSLDDERYLSEAALLSDEAVVAAARADVEGRGVVKVIQAAIKAASEQ